MPAQTFGLEPVKRPAFDQRRRSERRLCNLDVVVRADGAEFPAFILDISDGGFGLRIATLMTLKPGARLLVIHPEFGEVPCALRWTMPPRYGAEFTGRRSARDRVHAFYDGLPPAAGEP